jgi:hypothetical protein
VILAAVSEEFRIITETGLDGLNHELHAQLLHQRRHLNEFVGVNTLASAKAGKLLSVLKHRGPHVQNSLDFMGWGQGWSGGMSDYCCDGPNCIWHGFIYYSFSPKLF